VLFDHSVAKSKIWGKFHTHMISTIAEIHRALSNTVWLFWLILGLWGLYRAIRGRGVDGHFIGAGAIGQGLFILQAILGGILWLGGLSVAVQRPGIHLLYGVFALVFPPFVYLVVLRGDDTNRAQWVLSFTALFMFGISLRAITTGI
jgi:hypothetical protein